MTVELRLEAFVDIIVNAVLKPFQNDGLLYKCGAHELAINHRIALYLEEELNYITVNQKTKFFVDIEFNKFQHVKGEREKYHLRPDIIVYQRNRSSQLAWIEIKIGENLELCDNDKDKICFVSSKSICQFGLSVLINYKKNIITVYSCLRSGEMYKLVYEFSQEDYILTYKLIENCGYHRIRIRIKQ